MLGNEPGAGNAQTNKIKFLISSCLGPQENSQTHKSIITVHAVKCHNGHMLPLREAWETIFTFTCLTGVDDGRNEKE